MGCHQSDAAEGKLRRSLYLRPGIKTIKLQAEAGEHSDIVPDVPRQKLLQVYCRALTERISILRYPRIAGLSP